MSFYPYLCFDNLSLQLKEQQGCTVHEENEDESTLLLWIKGSKSDETHLFPVLAMHNLVERIRVTASGEANGGKISDHSRQQDLKLARQILQVLLVRCSKEPHGSACAWELLKLSVFFAAHIATRVRHSTSPSSNLNKLNGGVETDKLLTTKRPSPQDACKDRQSITLCCLECLVRCCELLLDLDQSGALDRMSTRDSRALDKVCIVLHDSFNYN